MHISASTIGALALATVTILMATDARSLVRRYDDSIAALVIPSSLDSIVHPYHANLQKRSGYGDDTTQGYGDTSSKAKPKKSKKGKKSGKSTSKKSKKTKKPKSTTGDSYSDTTDGQSSTSDAPEPSASSGTYSDDGASEDIPDAQGNYALPDTSSSSPEGEDAASASPSAPGATPVVSSATGAAPTSTAPGQDMTDLMISALKKTLGKNDQCKLGYNDGNCQIINMDGGEVIEANYPVGSVASGNVGGKGRPACDITLPSPSCKEATISYEVFFPNDFDWVQGGKLAGLWGGPNHCSGGDRREKTKLCWSVRTMWRKNGMGEAYLYVPDAQEQGLCTDKINNCNGNDGVSFGRGKINFFHGKWNTISLTVQPNTNGANGSFRLVVNGVVLEKSGVKFSESGKVDVAGATFQTFFGGSSAPFAVKKAGTKAYYRNFKFAS